MCRSQGDVCPAFICFCLFFDIETINSKSNCRVGIQVQVDLDGTACMVLWALLE